MFKLAKILHSPTNSPEICYLPVSKNRAYKFGEALRLKSGFLDLCGTEEMPTHVTLGSSKSGSTDPIACMHICGDMIFEVELASNTSSLSLGEKAAIQTDYDGSAVLVAPNAPEGSATVYEFFEDHLCAGDKIYVRFI
jgi:hypothetical protein